MRDVDRLATHPSPQRKLLRLAVMAMVCFASLGGVFDLTAAQPPAFTAASVQGGSLHLTFTSEAGVTYQPEKADDASGPWTLLQAPVVGNGSPITVIDPVIFSPRAFYRVVADSLVFSVNIAAYANVSVSGSSWNLIANPFFGNTTLGSLFPVMTPSSQLLKVGVFDFDCSFYDDLVGWLDCTTFNPSITTLAPGEGAFVFSDQASVQTFVGLAPTGPWTNKLPAGLSLCSSIAPTGGQLKTDMGFPVQPGDMFFKFNRPAQNYDTFTYLGSDVWDPEEPVMTFAEPFWANLASSRNWASGGSGGYTVTNRAYNGGPNFLVPGGGNGTAPAITEEPLSRTNLLGSDATFTVSASGSLPLSYQWSFNGVPLPGATGSNYARVNVQGTNAGAYSVEVSNPYGVVSSAAATLMVPAVFLDLVPAGGSTSATNSTQVQLQTGFSNGAIFYTLDGTYPGRGKLYFGPFTLSTSAVVRVISYSADYSRSAESTPVNVTVVHSPGILAQPQNQNALIGGSPNFSITASGTAPLFYQWYFNGAPISGANSATLTLANVQSTNAGLFHAVVFNQFGNSTSIVAALNVFAPAGISSHPGSTNVPLNSAVTFSVSASGSPPLQYQWRLNGANLPGKTNSTLTIPQVKLTDGGSYTVVVLNEFGSVISDPAQLIVQVPPLQPGDQFESHVVLSGFTGSVSGSNTFATAQPGELNHAGKPGGRSVWYKWQPANSGVATIHTRGSSFDTVLAVYQGSILGMLIKVAEDDDSGGNLTSEVRFNAIAGVEYSIVIDGVGAATGYFVCSWTNLPTANVPVIISQPQDIAVQPGSDALFSVTDNGSDVSYQWFFNGEQIAGANSSTLTVNNVQLSNVGYYQVVIKNTLEQVAVSSPANLELSSQPGPPTRDKFADVSTDTSPPGLIALPGKAAASSVAFTTVAFGIPGTRDFVNTTSSSDLRDPSLCAVGGASRWIVLMPTNSGRLSLDTVGTPSTLPTILAVYRGGSFSDLIPSRRVACDVNSASDGHSLVRFDAEASQAYSVLVDGTNGATGQIHLNYCLGSLPLVTAPPESATTLLEGETLNLIGNVSAAVPTAFYQWYHDGVAIPGANSPVYNLGSVSTDAFGAYSLVASNCLGISSNVVSRVFVNLPLVVTFSAAKPDGHFDLEIAGGTGRPFMIQASTNLLNWIPVYTNITPFAWINFVHPTSAPHSNRFYRAVSYGQ